MLSVLTNAVLDIGFGVVYWITKKTASGIWMGLNYFIWSEEKEECSLKNENEFILMSDFKILLEEKNNEISQLKYKIKKLE